MKTKTKNVAKTKSATQPNPKRRRRRRRRNPWDTDDALTSALGAGIGSILGGLAGAAVGFGIAAKKVVEVGTATEIPESLPPGTVGSMMMLPTLTWIGSIAGGAIGGRVGAPDKKERRATIGGAVGGALGPIGAAIGGAVGGGHTARKGNPSTAATIGLVAASIAAVGAGAYGVSRWRRAAQLPPGEPVGGDTIEPDNGDGKLPTNIEKIYVEARFNEMTDSISMLNTSSDTVTYSGLTYPVDIVISVPADFQPIGKVSLGSNAKLVAGTPGTTRDVVVRVSKANAMGPSITFNAEYWPSGTSGYTNALKIVLR